MVAAYDLSTPSFLSALQRFAATKGKPNQSGQITQQNLMLLRKQ